MPSNCPRNRFGPSRPGPRRKSNTTLPPGRPLPALRLVARKEDNWFCECGNEWNTLTGVGLRIVSSPLDLKLNAFHAADGSPHFGLVRAVKRTPLPSFLAQTPHDGERIVSFGTTNQPAPLQCLHRTGIRG